MSRRSIRFRIKFKFYVLIGLGAKFSSFSSAGMDSNWEIQVNLIVFY